jgi:hypothetical protein
MLRQTYGFFAKDSVFFCHFSQQAKPYLKGESGSLAM